MAVRNLNWYALCQTMPYPLQDSASMLSDAGTRLPSDIICDLNLKFPDTLGYYAFVGSCTVTENIVTVILLGSTSPDALGGLSPLAAVSLLQPVDIFHHYPLEPLAEGVGGWIVFGHGIEQAYSGRFATPAQTLLSPRSARAYKPFPVRNCGKFGNATALTGLVNLVGGSDIEVVKATRDVPETWPEPAVDYTGLTTSRDVIVVRLANTTNNAQARNVLDLYRGPCSGRPESRTCGDPEPIELLGVVPPDCDGNVTIHLAGCASLAAISGEVTNGAVINCDTGLAEVCGNRHRLPNQDGTMPEDDLLCSISSYSLDLTEYEYGSCSIDEPVWVLPHPACSSLYFYDPFDSQLAGWTDVSGYMTVQSGAMTCDLDGVTGSVPNVKVYYAGQTGLYCETVVLNFKILPSDPGYGYNAGFVFGYHLRDGEPDFYTAEAYWDPVVSNHKTFRIRHWKGWTCPPCTVQEIDAPKLAVDSTYSMTVIFGEPDDEGCDVSATLYGVDQDDVYYTLAAVKRTPPASGRFGLFANRSRVEFYDLTIS